MAATFEGIREPLNYDTPGAMALPCLAANLSMLGAGEIEEIQRVLVARGVSDEQGVATISEDGLQYDGNGKRVSIGPASLYFELSNVFSAAETLFREGQGLMAAVKLHEDNPGDESMHFNLIFGHDIDKTSDPHVVVKTWVGDSRFDGTEAKQPSEVMDMLSRTLKATGVLFAYAVKVEDLEGSSRTLPTDIVRLPGGGETVHRD